MNEIQFLTSDVVATASSDGSVTLLKIDRDSLTNNSTGYKFVQVNKWNKIHSSCNGLSVNGDSIVSVGSDGKIFLLNGRRPGMMSVLLGVVHKLRCQVFFDHPFVDSFYLII